VAPGEGDVEALEIERDALEDVDEEELESCKFRMTSCILSPWRKAEPDVGMLNCLTPPLLIMPLKLTPDYKLTNFKPMIA